MFTLDIEEFSGPLDLLLQLIKKDKKEIKDINLEKITDEYLAYIRSQEELNLNIASEYLVMASELLEIKSRILLPRKEDEETEEEDPKERLINKLMEYEQYKNLTSSFKELESMRQEIYTKIPENLKEYSDDLVVTNNDDITLDDLMDAFKKFLERKKFSEPMETKVTPRGITVEDRRKDIRKILKDKKKVDFFELFEVVNKEYIVVTFLAILEMARKQELLITQENNFDKITCEVV